jgi:hypothetical protein
MQQYLGYYIYLYQEAFPIVWDYPFKHTVKNLKTILENPLPFPDKWNFCANFIFHVTNANLQMILICLKYQLKEFLKYPWC